MADPRYALVLRARGYSWKMVAEALGYANADSARCAANNHKRRVERLRLKKIESMQSGLKGVK